MRKILYGTTIVAGVLLVIVILGRQLHTATASQIKADNTVDVSTLETMIDVKALPRQEIPSEAFQ